MDKKSFINILSQYSSTSERDALEILSLKQKYPYSQLLHVLSAKVSKDHSFSTDQQELQLAAVYSTNRIVLKDIMATTAPSTDAVDVVKDRSDVDYTTQDLVIPVTESSIDSVDLASEIMDGLNRLHIARNNFESLFDDITSKAKAISFVPEKVVIHAPVSTDSEKETAYSKSKKERIIEIAKALESMESDAEKAPTRKKKKSDINEGLIEQIANSKKEIDPENEKQKAQIEIIDQFIKAQPNIGNAKDKPLPDSIIDHSTVNSNDFGDNIVSETLVDILLKQGKKEKAIEVLKKLIWKFPQKKAYFVAQIEELKK